MSSKTLFLQTVAVAAVIAMSSTTVDLACARGGGMADIDTDHDRSVSLDEAHATAQKKFARLDKDHDGRIEMKEISPTSKSITEMARHDKDHRIDQREYMSGVDAAFKEADPKGSGVLNAAALKTPAGKRFLDLVE